MSLKKNNNGPTKLELYETIEEIIEDPEYFYENPETELENSLRLNVLLKFKNIVIIAVFFIIVILCVGAWRTLTYGKTQEGYVVVTTERVEFLDYMNLTEEWQKEVLLFETNMSNLNKQSTYDTSVSSQKNETLNNNINAYKERVKWLEDFGQKKFVNKERNVNLKEYNDLMIQMYSSLIQMCENERYYSLSQDYNEEAVDSVADNYLTWNTDILLKQFEEDITLLNGYRVKLEILID